MSDKKVVRAVNTIDKYSDSWFMDSTDTEKIYDALTTALKRIEEVIGRDGHC